MQSQRGAQGVVRPRATTMNGHPTRLLVIVGTRPDVIKMAPVIRALRAESALDPVVVVTGQHRQLLLPVLADLDLEPDITLPPVADGSSLAASCGALLVQLDDCIGRSAPARVVVHGDTTTCAAASLAAFYHRIPIAHVEAGLRSGRLDRPWPEEFNRRLTGLAADLHFAPTTRAARQLADEGVSPGRIHVTGNTVVDALLAACDRLDGDAALAARAAVALPPPLPGRRRLVVTLHRREAIGVELDAMCLALRELVSRHPLEIVLPLHRNPAVRGTIERALGSTPAVHLLAPLGYYAFIALLRSAWLVITDSGGVQEEAPSLDVPVVIARSVTERPELVAAGGAILGGTSSASLTAAVETLLDDTARYRAMQAAANPFGDGQAAHRIVDLLKREQADASAA